MDRFENVIDSEIVIGNEVVVEQVLSSEPINAVKVPMPIELQDKEVEPTINEQVITADKGFSGLGTVSVGAVTSDIDENITARNIRGGVTILGVTGDLEPDKPDQSKVVEPSTSEQVVTADSGYELASVTIGAVTSSIDPNIKAENIKENESILGVVGTFKGGEDLDGEIAEQNALLTELESGVNELPDKPYDMLQQMVDQTNSCEYLCYQYRGSNGDFLSGLDVSNVTNAKSMFQSCNIKKIPQLNTSNITDMSSMFEGARITEIPPLDVSSATTLSRMFTNCSSLTTVSLLNTGNVKSMNSLFAACGVLAEIPELDTSNVTDMYQMFYQCYKIKTIPQFDTSNVTRMDLMFKACSGLTEVPELDTSNVTNITQMFISCPKLTTIPLLDVINTNNLSSLFDDCKALTNLNMKNIKHNLQIGSGTKWGTLLTDESITNTFQELWDMTGSSAKTLTMSTPSNARTEAIYVKLIDITDEMRAEDKYIDNKKPCVVCESTDEGAITLKEYGISKNWNIA